MTEHEAPQGRIIDRIEEAHRKLERYEAGDPEILERVADVAKTVEGWLETADSMDPEEVKETHKAWIMNGIMDTREQKALYAQLFNYGEKEEYLHSSDPKTMQTIQTMFEAGGGCLRDLVALTIVTWTTEVESIHECLIKLLKQYKSPELDRVITENLGENYFKESLTNGHGRNGKGNGGGAAVSLLEVISDKQKLMDTFAALTEEGKTVKSEEDPEQGMGGYMFAFGMLAITENLTEHQLEKLSKKEIEILLAGIREFYKDDDVFMKHAIKTLEKQLHEKEFLESLN